MGMTGVKDCVRVVHHVKSKVRADSSNGDPEDVRNAAEKPLGFSVCYTQSPQ